MADLKKLGHVGKQTKYKHQTQEEWEATAQELFGGDKAAWEFVCPACGNVASVELARENWPELKGSGWAPHQECVGRYSEAVKCDWAAYGLFQGPQFVNMPDGKTVPVFAFKGTGIKGL